MNRPLLLFALAALALLGCSTLSHQDPLQVTVVGIEPLKGEGLELRMMVKLRVQNPNDTPVDYSGVYVKLDVQDRTFATGVSDASGSVAGFNESIISVPVTVSVLRMARQVMGVLDGKPVDEIRYSMSGKLNRSAFRSLRFQSKGEFTLKPLEQAAREETT
ncbi:MAG: LEA type 2 family protein [Gammaproteobacteria bacterium]|nr:LEA type 2 family protein [Gammaproteobacteria bacterium]